MIGSILFLRLWSALVYHSFPCKRQAFCWKQSFTNSSLETTTTLPKVSFSHSRQSGLASSLWIATEKMSVISPLSCVRGVSSTMALQSLKVWPIDSWLRGSPGVKKFSMLSLGLMALCVFNLKVANDSRRFSLLPSFSWDFWQNMTDLEHWVRPTLTTISETEAFAVMLSKSSTCVQLLAFRFSWSSNENDLVPCYLGQSYSWFENMLETFVGFLLGRKCKI